MKRPIQIETGEWWFLGCFIQESEHPKLIGKYEVFKDNDNQDHIGRCYTMTEAKHLCKLNEVKNPVSGWKEQLNV